MELTKLQYFINTADTLKCYIFEDNIKIIPSSATLNVYRPGSSKKIISSVVMSVATDGLLSYPLTASHNATAGKNYKAVIVYVADGMTYYLTLFYDVVKLK